MSDQGHAAALQLEWDKKTRAVVEAAVLSTH